MNSDKKFTFKAGIGAPLHYLWKADNARFTAFLMQKDGGGRDDEAASEAVGYSGSQEVARREAFLRESAVSLELIVKAVIAQRIEAGHSRPDVRSVKMTHNIPVLWRDADLQPLSNPDQRRLIFARQILVWAGRYAAPRDAKVHQKDTAEDRALNPSPKMLGRFRIETSIDFGWEEFDHLFQIALSGFVRSREKFEQQFGSFN